MRRYKDFQPTAFDQTGLLADYHDIGEFWVAPVSRTRDSGPLSESNFETALEMLGGEDCEKVQVHRFGHWGPGWFEIILVDPADVEKVKILEDMERALEDYPVLNEEDFSEKEHDEAWESWECWAHTEFCEAIGKAFDLLECTVEFLDGLDNGLTWQLFMDMGGEYYSEDSGVCIRFESAIGRMDRPELAKFIWSHKYPKAA